MYDECHCRFELEEKPRCAPCNAPRTARGSRIATEASFGHASGRNLESAIDDLSMTTKRECRARKVRSRAKCDSSGRKRVFWTGKLLERRCGKPVNVPDQGLKHKLERANRRDRRYVEASKA
jgi:hypothetical protein